MIKESIKALIIVLGIIALTPIILIKMAIDKVTQSNEEKE